MHFILHHHPNLTFLGLSLGRFLLLLLHMFGHGSLELRFDVEKVVRCCLIFTTPSKKRRHAFLLDDRQREIQKTFKDLIHRLALRTRDGGDELTAEYPVYHSMAGLGGE